ncbi:MAG: ATP-binding cassette domain-containing protein, partial [Xanthobacteraceae bacterium]
MTTAAISFEHVGVDYGAERRALDDVSLESRAGEFLAIVGPSGSGKTTLLRLINRLSDPTSGIVNVNGE